MRRRCRAFWRCWPTTAPSTPPTATNETALSILQKGGPGPPKLLDSIFQIVPSTQVRCGFHPEPTEPACAFDRPVQAAPTAPPASAFQREFLCGFPQKEGL